MKINLSSDWRKKSVREKKKEKSEVKDFLALILFRIKYYYIWAREIAEGVETKEMFVDWSIDYHNI